MPRVISTGDAPVAVGAYSQATTDGDLVFTAGQLPLTPDGDRLEGGRVPTEATLGIETIAVSG